MPSHLHLAVVEVGRAWLVADVLTSLAQCAVESGDLVRFELLGIADCWVAVEPSWTIFATVPAVMLLFTESPIMLLGNRAA